MTKHYKNTTVENHLGAVDYQFAQFVLKIDFVLAKKVGYGRWVSIFTWWLSWVAVERHWSAPAGPLLSTLAQKGLVTIPLPL